METAVILFIAAALVPLPIIGGSLCRILREIGDELRAIRDLLC